MNWQTDRQTEAMTIPLWPERPRGNKMGLWHHLSATADCPTLNHPHQRQQSKWMGEVIIGKPSSGHNSWFMWLGTTLQEVSNLRFWHHNAIKESLLTLLVPMPQCSGRTRSTTWLLIPWRLASFGHQVPWLQRINAMTVKEEKWIITFHEEGFQLPANSYCWQILEGAKIYLCFIKTNQQYLFISLCLPSYRIDAPSRLKP